MRWSLAVLAVAVVGALLEARRRTLRAQLEREEGRVAWIYRDEAGLDTFGIGHKVLASDRDLRQYSQANPAPDAVIDAYFEQDIARASSAVDALGIAFSDNERAALVSLVFNIGTGAFDRSTLKAQLVAGDKAGAADSMLAWRKITKNGEKQDSPALLARRQRERELFLTA